MSTNTRARNILERFSRAGPRGRGREWVTLGEHPLTWLLSNNRLEKVPFVSVLHTSSSRLLLSNQDKGCTPSVAHSLPLPLGPALLNLWSLSEDLAHKIPHGCSAQHCRLALAGRPNPAKHRNLAMGPYNVWLNGTLTTSFLSFFFLDYYLASGLCWFFLVIPCFLPFDDTSRVLSVTSLQIIAENKHKSQTLCTL